jgi:hypothetical protein
MVRPFASLPIYLLNNMGVVSAFLSDISISLLEREKVSVYR